MSDFFEYINLYLNASIGVQLPSYSIIIAILILIFSLNFIFYYVRPALILWFRLWQLQNGLKAFKNSGKMGYPAELFNRSRTLKHLWAEYKETLHEQRSLNQKTGTEDIIAIRSTMPAEAFFNPGVLVNSQLHAEFFKHLPGILTGMGIIGTFLGLMHGLSAFQISEDTQIVRQSLDQLLRGVYEAFLISVGAIGIAMIMTSVEKFLLSALYQRVEELCFTIDSLYETGSSEEYLERLIKSSEASLHQSRLIKDHLVAEFRQVLHEVTRQHIDFTFSSQEKFGDQLKQMIQLSISNPLQSIILILKNQHQTTGQEISNALDKVLTNFVQKLHSSFGGQTAEIHELQQQTAQALQTTIQQFQQMITSIDTTGRSTTTTMIDRMTKAMEDMDIRQQAANEHWEDFLGKIREVTQENQVETGQKFRDLLSDIGQQMTCIINDSQTQMQVANHDQQGRHQQIADATLTTITTLSNGTQKALHTIQEQLTHTLTQLEQYTQRIATQQEEQQRQLATHNQRAVQHLTASVDQSIAQVSTQTADWLATLVRTMENQQATMIQAVTRMTADLQAQMRAATDDQHGRHQQMADAMLTAINALSGGVQGALQTMQGQLMNTLTQLEQHTQRTVTQQEEQQRQLATHNQRAVQHLTASVDQSIAQVSAQTTSLLNTLVRIVENQQQAANETVHATHAAITRIGSVTNSAIADMNQGAETLMVAAREFSKAGQSVSGALGETAGVAAKLSMSADAMSTATRSIGDIVSDYGMIRQQLNEMIQSLKSVVEAARKEASLTTDVLVRIDNAAQKLAVAQNQADHYLDQVTDVLQQTHQAFASGMRHTLEEANQQFFHHLTAATSKLREAIEELEVTLSSVGDRTTRS